MSAETKIMWSSVKKTMDFPGAWLLITLGFMLCVSAFLVVYVKNQHRERFIILQHLYAQRDAKQTEFAQLLLEKSTWSAHEHVESMASTNLNMKVPAPADIKLLSVPTDPS